VKVEARSLRIHPHAQRDLVLSKLKKLRETLDLDAIGVLHGVEYEINGVTAIWIIDGQHRLRALMDHGFGEWMVEVKIHLDATDDARASELFLRLNDRSPVSPYDKFKNEMTANHPDAVGIVNVLRARGLKVSRTTGDGNVCCVNALKKLHTDGGKTLVLTIDTILSAWGRTAAAVEGKIIEGLGMVYGRYNGSVDQQAMVKKLAKYPGGAPGLIGDAKGVMNFRRSTLSHCVAEVIIERYNSGRKAGRLELI